MPGLRAPAVILAVALLATACGGALPTSDVTSAPAATTAPTSEATPVPATDAPATDAPTEPPTEAPTEPPTDEPTAPPTATPTLPPFVDPTATTPAGSAEACTGTDDNRAFFVSIARAVDWSVLCGVLPKGWYVSTGRYRTGNGGWMYIGYKGPGGATMWLYQGSYCATQGGCPALGTDLGEAPLGSLGGTLHETADGYAVVVDPGSTPSWVMVTSGLDQAATLQLAAAAAEVGE